MKKELKNILVPVDFKEPSLKAVNYAYNLAVQLNAEIILLHILQTSGLIADFFSNGNELVKMTNKAKDKLLDIVDSVHNEKNVKITSMVELLRPIGIVEMVRTGVVTMTRGEHVLSSNGYKVQTAGRSNGSRANVL